ncbi:hypothetical protein [Campylobacter fetus]|uniref:hypothetical protein n=1 Tax=Campylobacter fetus TaxID=196 RepID=UPI0013D49B71|nr:hypothetical protein [Campylobacter fetus]
MIPINLLKNDLNNIFQTGNISILQDGSQVRGYLNKNTKLYFDNGLSDEVITFLCTADLSVGDFITIDSIEYEIYRIDHENQALNRLFLRLHDDP